MSPTSEGADRHRGRAVSVWLADEDVAQLKQIAKEKGIGHTTLIRMWVKERLSASHAVQQDIDLDKDTHGDQ